MEKLRELNPQVKISHVLSNEFRTYGRLVEDLDFSDLIAYCSKIRSPSQGVTYQRSIPELERLPIKVKIQNELYGEMPIQIGLCSGYNSQMNAMEYHKGHETIIAVTDLLLILGKMEDLEGFIYESFKSQSFYVPAKTAVELFSTTLHYAPINVELGEFKALIVLPAGTNMPFAGVHGSGGENNLLFAKNKWLISHEAASVSKLGAHVGIKGDNISIRFR